MTTKNIQKKIDLAISRTARTAVGSFGASFEILIDRMLTYAAAQMVSMGGKAHAAAALRKCADVVEGGLFDHLDDTAKDKKH